jgi:hypothetical protein
MAENNKTPKMISAEEMLRVEILINQALIDILIAKEIISEKEILYAIGKIKSEQHQVMNEFHLNGTGSCAF